MNIIPEKQNIHLGKEFAQNKIELKIVENLLTTYTF